VNRPELFVVIAMLTVLGPAGASAQDRSFPLETVSGLTLISATAEPVTYEAKKGLRVVASDEALRRYTPADGELNPMALIQGIEFSSGVIEAEIAGAPGPGAGEGARGFVGIAFRVQKDPKAYDAFYLRPTNGRADDQVRRNHSAQYIAHPAWPWQRLRKESPEKYEAYVDLVPGAWTKIKIEVRGEQARLYVHDQPQPTLVINDVKSGAKGSGAIALWVGPGTVAHFRNVRVMPAK
jgi:3-keto-disaccharide hydrolase